MPVKIHKHRDLDILIKNIRKISRPQETNKAVRAALPYALTPALLHIQRNTPKHKGPYPPTHRNAKLYNRAPGMMRRSMTKRAGKVKIKKVNPFGLIVSEGDAMTNIYFNYKGRERFRKSMVVFFGPERTPMKIYGKFSTGVLGRKSPKGVGKGGYDAAAEKAGPEVADRLRERLFDYYVQRMLARQF